MLLQGKVAVVTGSGRGIGRSIALELAREGAKVVVNDVGCDIDGRGGAEDPAQQVVNEIKELGSDAAPNYDSVSDFNGAANIIKTAVDKFGRIDILVNNAGILRDKSFAKMELADFRAVIDVHLMGAVHCSKAVWEKMRGQNYGRIVFTSSSSGLYGNFGQSNYGAAKAAMIGLMNVLHLEGQKNGIRVNILSPTAATRMTDQFLPAEDKALLAPEAVTPGLLYLVSEEAPSGVMLCAGAGCFARAELLETEGIYLPADERTPEAIAARFADIASREGAAPLPDAWSQTKKYVTKARSEVR